jgi:peptidoglycan/LPS O-acetylase OafA/YrhL
MTNQTATATGNPLHPQLADAVVDAKQETWFPYFDWLRFALASVVMWAHFDRLHFWSHASNFAVQVFFALSGWLIGGILLHLKRADIPRFYFNRVIRIWAPYFLALALLIAASLLREPVTAKWLEFVTYKATFVWNFFGTQQLATFVDAMPLRGTGNHFWSVNAEEQFYLIAPMLLVFAAPFIGRSVLLWVVLAAAAWWMDVYASIVFGVLAAVLHHHYPDFHTRTSVRAFLLLVVGASVALFASALPYPLVAPAPAIAVVLLLAVPGKKSFIGSLAGGLSYPLYLNHWIGIFVANALLGRFGMRGSWTATAVAVVVSIGLAAAMYWWIDRRLLANRNALFTQVRGRLAMAASYALLAAGIAFGLVMTRS